jgi:hypothetical protein
MHGYSIYVGNVSINTKYKYTSKPLSIAFQKQYLYNNIQYSNGLIYVSKLKIFDTIADKTNFFVFVSRYKASES